MNHRIVASSSRVLLERWLLWTLAVVVAMALAAPVCAAGSGVDSIVVKFQEGVVPPNAASIPMEAMSRLRVAIGAPLTIIGQTRDGAFTLQLAAPLDHDGARAALNTIRLERSVLYANIAPGAPTPAAGPPTNRIIVKYRDQALIANAQVGVPLDQGRLARLTGLTGQPLAWLRGGHDGSNVLLMLQRLSIAQVEAIAARIAQEADVDYAQPDYIRTAQIVPTDPCYASSVSGCAGGYQWDLFDPVGGINMPAAWDITTGSAGINVAVIDTGALVNHPDLAGRFVGGYDMIADCAVANDGEPSSCTWSNRTPNMLSRDSIAADPGDWITAQETNGILNSPPYFWFQGCGQSNSSWHGTHVAGTIGAVPNNGIGIAGINWVSHIVPVRVLGKCGGYTSDIVAAIVWAAGGNISGIPANANPARVLSMSFGGSGSCSAAEQNAITTALGLGAVVVVAAGNNNGSAGSFSPASCNGVITVAATNKAGRKSWYSNWGSAVEIAAPGGSADGSDTNILSTLNSGTTSPSPSGYIYANYAGTSMATPHVSGVASLMLSVNPALTPSQVLAKIQATARVFPTPGPACTNPPSSVSCNCTTALCGAGIIDAAAAVTASLPGGAVPTTTTMISSPNPSTVGASVTFTATVNGTNPTGTVNFKDGASSIASCNTQAVTGVGNSRTAVCTTSTLAVGTHSITATYGGDPGNMSSTSTPPLSQVVVGTQSNVALASTGAVASASSTYSASFPVAAVNNGDRTGVGWGAGGGWNDATAGVFPDFVQIVFNGFKTIDHVIVYTLQDNPFSPIGPTDITTFSLYGITDFSVDGWNGSNWVNLGTVTGNNLVKRTVNFSAFTTDRIRVNVNNALASYSRIVEVEAFGVPAATMQSNVAAATLGATASASSTFSASFPVAAVNDGDRTGAGWGAGGGWADATIGVFPDSVQIVFSGQKTIDHVIVYTLQDNLASLVEPTDSMIFSLYGITDFSVDGWNGSNWVTLGTVTGNNLVKRTVNFSAFTTDRMRVNVNNALASYSRIVEVEAFGVPAATMQSNVAAATLGAAASASSTFSASFPVAAVNDGDRTGAGWGAGGGWADATIGVFPDSVQIVFSGQKTIDHVIVYTLQDNLASLVEPTDSMIFSLYGITDFSVDGWNGSTWVTLGTVTGNNRVKRTVNFTAFATDRIRVNVNNALASYSRIVEIEAWGN